MSVENVKKFYELVDEDEELQQGLKSLREKETAEVLQDIVSIGAEKGLDFTEEEVQDYQQKVLAENLEEEELSAEDLEQVAGGQGDYNNPPPGFEKAKKASNKQKLYEMFPDESTKMLEAICDGFGYTTDV